MESTWERRELPVLVALIELADESPGAPLFQVSEVAERGGVSPEEAFVALRAMENEYCDLQLRNTLIAGNHVVGRPYPGARRAVGQWPTPEVFAERLIAALSDASEQATDADSKSKLRAAAESVGRVGRDALAEVIAAVVAKQSGLG